MKINFKLLPVAVMALMLAVTSCKKDKDNLTDYTDEYTAMSDDGTRFSNEDDALSDDASNAMEGSLALSGGRTDAFTICDATVTYDTTAKTATITYNGTNCAGNRTRTGVVTLQLTGADRWKDAHAKLTITITNLKITRTDGKSITINGTRELENVTGGLVRNLAGAGHITHTVNSNDMSVKFDNGTQRTWSVAKQRDFTYDNGIVIAVTGTHTENGVSGIAVWGTNRAGNSFSYTVTKPLVVRQDCDFRLTGGEVVYQKLVRTLTVLFGLDADGNATNCPGAGGHYYFKASWTNANGVDKSVVRQY